MAKCAACYVYIILIILCFPLSIYLLSLICSYSYFEFSRFNVMKRIGYTAVDGSQFCVHQVSLPLAPVMFNRCHQQLASVTCVATHVWRWLSWHHKEANIFLTRPHAPPWKFDNAGHLLFRCFLELEEGYMFCLGLFNISVKIWIWMLLKVQIEKHAHKYAD